MASSCEKLEVVGKAAAGTSDKPGDCPFTQRVLMTCELKDIIYDVKYVDLDKKPDWFLKASPEGKVPLIKINGKWVADSDVIVNILESEYPCPPLSTSPKVTCLGNGIFPAFVAFFKSKDRCDQSECKLVCELDIMNEHLKKNGPYIEGDYVTSADVALAPKLYHLQIALAHYKNWSNIEPCYPALTRYMKLMFNIPAFKQTAPPPAVVVKGWAKHWPA